MAKLIRHPIMGARETCEFSPKTRFSVNYERWFRVKRACIGCVSVLVGEMWFCGVNECEAAVPVLSSLSLLSS